MTPAPATAPWPFAPLCPLAQRRRALQEVALRAGRLPRWPEGLHHLPARPADYRSTHP